MSRRDDRIDPGAAALAAWLARQPEGSVWPAVLRLDPGTPEAQALLARIEGRDGDAGRVRPGIDGGAAGHPGEDGGDAEKQQNDV